jgi:hypothetical protein
MTTGYCHGFGVGVAIEGAKSVGWFEYYNG